MLFATGDGWWDSEWICECNRRAIEGDSREVVSPAGCRDHPEELKHRRCFIWSGCSSSRSFMSQVFLFPIPPFSPHLSLYFLSFQASPARIMPESMMSHLMNLFPLLIVQSLKPTSSKTDNQKGTVFEKPFVGQCASCNAILSVF